MNEWDIEEARDRFVNHPVLGPGTRTLYNLMVAVNRNSDGWPYWQAPQRAAAKLMALIEGDGGWEARYGDREDVTPEKLKAALVPLKAFRTREKIDFIIEDFGYVPPPPPIGEHLRSICREAGLGAMVGIFEVVHDREQVTEETLRALVADDVTAFYDTVVGPAIYTIENHLTTTKENA